MSSIQVIPGQTLPDIAALHCGSMSKWPELAALNGLGLTSDLTGGQSLLLPDPSTDRKPEKVENQPSSAKKTVIAQAGQTLADLAIQYLGSLASWADLAALNGLGLTDAITPGQALILPGVSEKRVAAYYKSGGYFPAAGAINTSNEGVAYWGIEYDFIVQ